MEILCNIVIVFDVTFDQFNVSFLNKSITFFKKQQQLIEPTFLLR